MFRRLLFVISQQDWSICRVMGRSTRGGSFLCFTSSFFSLKRSGFSRSFCSQRQKMSLRRELPTVPSCFWVIRVLIFAPLRSMRSPSNSARFSWHPQRTGDGQTVFVIPVEMLCTKVLGDPSARACMVQIYLRGSWACSKYWCRTRSQNVFCPSPPHL